MWAWSFGFWFFRPFWDDFLLGQIYMVSIVLCCSSTIPTGTRIGLQLKQQRGSIQFRVSGYTSTAEKQMANGVFDELKDM